MKMKMEAKKEAKRVEMKRRQGAEDGPEVCWKSSIQGNLRVALREVKPYIYTWF